MNGAEVAGRNRRGRYLTSLHRQRADADFRAAGEDYVAVGDAVAVVAAS